MRDSRTAGSVKDRSKSLMFCPNCHWKWPRFPCPNRFGSSRPRNPPTPVPCPTDAPKLMLPVCFSVTRKITSTSPWSLAGRVSGNGRGCWKKPRFEMFWYERMSASCRNTSPGNSTIASRITRSWVTSLPEISILLTIAGCPSLIAQRRSTTGFPTGAPDHLGARLHVDVAVVVVQGPHLLGGVVPFLLVEVDGPLLGPA